MHTALTQKNKRNPRLAVILSAAKDPRIGLCCGLFLPLLAIAQTTLPPGVTRLDGKDPASNITYVLLSTPGKLIGPTTQPEIPPTLTAQCTQTSDGKQHFELLANFGGVPTLSFIPPWHQTPGENFPPPVPHYTTTMEFLGYTKVKPVRRQWQEIPEISGELKYSTPGGGTSNLEQIAFYMQYVRALPTLRLTLPDHRIVEFDTTRWQPIVRAEPLCHLSGL